MQELYDIACETNLMLAPINSPREIYASAQLAAREFFGPVGDVERFPRSFVGRALAPTAKPPPRRPTTVWCSETPSRERWPHKRAATGRGKG